MRPKGFLHLYILFLCLWILLSYTERSFSASEIKDPNTSQEINNNQIELSERLEELIQQLNQERSDYYSQKTQYETKIKQARGNREILEEEFNELQQQETDLYEQIQKYKTEIDNLNEQLATKSSLDDILQDTIQPFITKQQTLITQGIPYKQNERLAKLNSIIENINDSNDFSLAAQLDSIWSFTLEELRTGRSSETYTVRAQIDDDSSPYARFFRVGHKILGYITEDAQQTAMWSSLNNHNDWLYITDKNQAEQIRSTVEILDHLQPPEFVILPIPLKSTSLDKENSNVSP